MKPPLVSLELRWFVDVASFQRLEQWFLDDLPSHEVGPVEERRDHYLRLGPADDAGVKFSRGKIEVKVRDTAYPFRGAHQLSGTAERWRKWEVREADPQFTDPDPAALGSCWIAVAKHRTQRKYRYEGERFTPVPSAQVPEILDVGVAVEVSRLEVLGTQHASVCIEAFSPDPAAQEELLQLGVASFLGQLPSTLRPPGGSFGYAHWLASIDGSDGDDSGDAETTREFMNAEYAYLTSQFAANEELGDKRVSTFVSLTAGLGAAAVLVQDKLAPDSAGLHRGLFLAVNAVWLVFGYLTFLRVIHRNAETDRLKKQMGRMRRWFVRFDETRTRAAMPYDPYKEEDTPRGGLRLIGGNGGYAELVALINSLLVATLVYQVLDFLRVQSKPLFETPSSVAELLAALVGAVAGLAVWVWADRAAKRRGAENAK